MDFPIDPQEFRGAWSATAGEVTGLDLAILTIEPKVSAAYIHGRDEAARELRDTLKEIQEHRKRAAARLQAYIDEDGRRRYCIAKGVK